ncbi:MAG: 30S ribosomal protein S16 [Rhodothermaceae bacterium]|nr:30S ribosomal protein S16 [Rhodothermaceae bacterium]MYD18207.1 30S ribosomal protein S16 [Rhodothermaceae bacterium]MYI43451.1 30S ribosomal protein S16 [Rhodothermaceae bacterium]
MAVKIRLRRMGRKKKPIWALVAADSRAPRDGKFIEDLGRYYPQEEPSRVELREDRIKYWLEVGAQPTDTVRNLLSRRGVLLGLHLERKGIEPEVITEAVDAHRQHREDRLVATAKTTPADRRQKALVVETEAAAKKEEELIKKRKKAAAEKAAAKEKARQEEEARQAAQETEEAEEA